MTATASEKLLPWHVRAVSTHRNQTLLVEELLRTGFLERSEIRNLADPETGGDRTVYEWHFFTELDGHDHLAPQRAGVAVLRSDYGDWVGFDSFGSPYDLYVRPSLIKALFGIETDAEGIRNARAP